MELVWIIVFLAAIMLIISDSKIGILKEERHFLREENILLRNDIRRMIFLVENLTENEKRKDNNFPEKKHKTREKRKKNNKIFIFNGSESMDESQKLRVFLKKNYVDRIALIDFKVLFSKLSSKDDAGIEESFLINKNLDNLSIIFYGGNPADFEAFLIHYKWKERRDIEWIKNPFEVEELKKALKEIRNKNVK